MRASGECGATARPGHLDGGEAPIASATCAVKPVGGAEATARVAAPGGELESSSSALDFYE